MGDLAQEQATADQEQDPVQQRVADQAQDDVPELTSGERASLVFSRP